MLTYRQRVYAEYVSEEGGVHVPDSVDGLAPVAPYLNRLIAQHFPPDRNARILDLGCGHGALIHFARQAGYGNVEGVDNSPSQLAGAQRLGIGGIRQGDLLTALADCPAESYDAIVTFDVIEHLLKDELFPAADAVHRALRPGGRWIIHVPNGLSPFCGAVRYADLTHELAFTTESLAQLVLPAGFARVTFFEDVPVPHGLKSGVRWVLWHAIRALLRVYVAAETGSTKPPILSQNLLAVAFK